MKKTLAMLLALVMVLACIPAMAEDVENPYEEDGVVIRIDPATGKPYDLGGMEIIIAQWWGSDWHETIGEAETSAAEATEEYRLWLEETYNFTIKEAYATEWGATTAQDFTNFVTTGGGEENYVWVINDGYYNAPVKAELAYDLSTLDCLDFEEDKWNDMLRELTTVDGKIYGMRPQVAEPRLGVFFNYRLLAEAGIDGESLYDMQQDGTWTWEAFEDLCQKLQRDVDNDGLPDQYAMMSLNTRLWFAALTANNTGFVLTDEEGRYVNAAETQQFLDTANWIMDMTRTYEKPVPEGANWDYFESAFINAEVPLMVHEEYFSGSLEDMEDDFGFVFFPKGPNATSHTWAPGDNAYLIPGCYDAERAWKIAFAFNLFTDPTPGYTDDDDWMNGYYNKYRDDRAVEETLATMRDVSSQAFWYPSIIAGYDLGEQYVWDVAAGNATPAEKSEQMRATWQAFLDEANALNGK